MQQIYITEEDFPEVEMELFSKEYPCYLQMEIIVIDEEEEILYSQLYETELIEGKWLLKTKI